MSIALLRPDRWKWTRALLVAGCMAAMPLPAWAQGAAAPSDSAMVNLVRALVGRGVLTEADGQALIAQAEAEASQARAAQAQAQAAAPPPPEGTIRVPYVPETVRAQIREDIKREVLAQAQAENWAAPGEGAPEWTKRITLSGDVRVRMQSNLYSDTNSNSVFDFARINANGPFPIADDRFNVPTINTRVDRAGRLVFRTRLGLDAMLSEEVRAGVRIATGDDASPISTNASLGGGLGKRDIWLDRAFIDLRPVPFARALLGRFDNPFESTDLLFDDDLNFDGVVIEARSADLLPGGLELTARGGAFPLDFGSNEFPNTAFDKEQFGEKWLFSGQLALKGEIEDTFRFTVAAGYYSFTNVQGSFSQECFPFALDDRCSTDEQRPFFLRKGNTLFPLRNLNINVPAPLPNEFRAEEQFVGLSLDYDVLNLMASVDFDVTDTLTGKVVGDYVKNLGFDEDDLCRSGAALASPVNNVFDPVDGVGFPRGFLCAANSTTRYIGGDQGFLVSAGLGTREQTGWGSWWASVTYRYLESDATLDALTDSNFALGGTNNKGFVLSASAGLYENLRLRTRWLSSNEIEGEPLAIDVLQVDLEYSF